MIYRPRPTSRIFLFTAAWLSCYFPLTVSSLELDGMKLGLQTYSLYLHGIGQDWAGFKLPWPRQISTFQLFDLGVELGLEGFHLDDGCLESLERSFLEEVAAAAAERGLYLEYNMSLDLCDQGIGKYHDLKEAVEFCQALGADTCKVGMDIIRPRPRSASRFHPQVMEFLNETAALLKDTAPFARAAGVRLALENHCDSFSEEIIWVLDQVDESNVGACFDTVNALHMTEDPRKAAEVLIPRAFTNHFRDNRIVINRDGFSSKGCASGEGDIDLKYCYELLRDNAHCERINIETDMGFEITDMESVLRQELDTLKRCIRYCREVLGIGREDRPPAP
jgi:sugar phosphate isomerase/epimerase